MSRLDKSLLLPLIYRVLLRRKSDEAGLRTYSVALRDGTMRRRDVVRALRDSEEHAEVRRRTRAIRRCVIRYATQFVGTMLKTRTVSNELIVRTAYTAFLGREPDPDGYDYWLTRRRRRLLHLRHVFLAMHQSTEFALLNHLSPDPLQALHEARIHFVRERLPPAQTVVDLGGAARGHPEGALLELGYRYRPRELLIVDLPPLQRVSHDRRRDLRGFERRKVFKTNDGIVVRYMYRPMWDLAPVSDGSIHLVFSGQSIEHVTIPEARDTLAEAFRVLEPGGWLWLDTPNAAMTRLQSPNELINPEHKHEYTIGELRKLIEDAGFKVTAEIGLRAMALSRRDGMFNSQELVNGPAVVADPEDGYLIAVGAQKPAHVRAGGGT